MEVAGAIEPRFGCEARNVSHECVAFPVPDRVSHIGIDRVKSDLIEMNSPFGAGVFEDHEHLHRSLNDLKLVRHVHGARHARLEAPNLRIAIQPIGEILLLSFRRPWLVRDLIAFDDAEIRRHPANGA